VTGLVSRLANATPCAARSGHQVPRLCSPASAASRIGCRYSGDLREGYHEVEDLVEVKIAVDLVCVLGGGEQLLRVYTIAEFANSRVAVEDVEIGGVTIRAGDPVLALSNAANHDPSVFDEADEIKFDRGARNHVAFGFGIHQCLGQNLARMELQIVFDTLFRRIPTLRLAAPADKLPYKDGALIYGIHEVPVTWEEPA
jgi:cytochrome P450